MPMTELSPEIRAQRVAVAKDVIARIALRKIKLRQGRYCAPDARIRHRLKELVAQGADLQSCVDEIEPCCHVCAKGALFLSKARLFNEVPMSALVSYGSVIRLVICEALGDIFDQVTLDRIEVAFECDSLHGNFDDSIEMIQAARRFGKGYLRPADRCQAVMENMVANDGEFLPPTSD